MTSTLVSSISALLLALVVPACASSSSVDRAGAGDGSSTNPYTTTSKGGASIELLTAPAQPPVRGRVQFEVHVHDAAGAPRDGLRLSVTAWMASHGHGASGMPMVTPLGDGVYRVDGCALVMPGSWQIHVSMSDSAGFEDDATTTIDVR